MLFFGLLGEDDLFEALTPDSRGFYTLSVPFDQDAQLSVKLEEDLGWYEVLKVPIIEIIDVITLRHVFEVKFKNKDLVMAAYAGLKEKYPGLKIDF